MGKKKIVEAYKTKKQKLAEIRYLKARIGDTDVNGTRYYNTVKQDIMRSKIDSKNKDKLFKFLEETSGMYE